MPSAPQSVHGVQGTMAMSSKLGQIALAKPVSINPFTLKKPPTVEDIHLTGACDWYKISRLVHAENKLISLLRKDGLEDRALKLEQMRDGLLAHRIANTPFGNMKMFLRNNCGNDVFIHKWRNDIDKFDIDLTQAMKKSSVNPFHKIELRYQSQLLKQQARASLPFTGYMNSVPSLPKISPGIFKEHKYQPRFVFEPFQIPSKATVAGFL